MAYIDRIKPHEAHDEVETFYEKVRTFRGGIANVHQIMSLNPSAMIAHMELYKSIMFQRSKLSRIERERIAVAVSSENKCDYCVAHHAETLRYLGEQEIIVDGLSKGIIPSELPEEFVHLLEWVKKITSEPHKTVKKDVDNLKHYGFTDRALLDASLAASYFSFINRIVMSLGVSIEKNYQETCGDS